MSKIKNIIIFVGIGSALILVYIFFIRSAPTEEALVSNTSSGSATTTSESSSPGSSIGQDFLSLLLNVKNIKLDDSIFADPAFASLRDSSIILVPDGNEGRPNPFAPIGSDNVSTSATGTSSGGPDSNLPPTVP